jgi:hypothetical protein
MFQGSSRIPHHVSRITDFLEEPWKKYPLGSLAAAVSYQMED